MFGKITTGSMVIAGILLFFILNSYSPTTGPGVILIVFFLLYIFCFGLIAWFLRIGSWVVKRIGIALKWRKPVALLKLTDAAYYSSIIAMAPVMIVAMHSVGEVSLYDIGLVILFVAIGAFYIKKRLG